MSLMERQPEAVPIAATPTAKNRRRFNLDLP